MIFIRKIVINFLFKIFSIFICLICLEILSTIFIVDPEEGFRTPCLEQHYDPYIKAGQCFNSQEEIAQMEYDTFVGYIPVANYSGIGWHTNNDHFRYNENFDVNKPEDEIRIFITGGSTAWGAGVTQEQTFAYLLEQKLNKIQSKKKIRVIIAAAGAWASSQEKVFIFNYVNKFNPDIIIMFSGWNDIYHAYTGKDYNKEQDFLMYKQAIHSCQSKIKPEGRISERSRDKFLSVSPPRYSEYSSKFWYLLNKIWYKYTFKKEQIGLALKSIQLDAKKIVKNTLENVELVNYLAKKHNFILIYCLQPSLYSTKKPLSLWERKLYKDSQESYIGFSEYSSNNYEVLKEYIKRNSSDKGYLFINGDKAINKEKHSIFVDHVHFSDRGNILIAEYLYDILYDVLVNKIK